MRLSNNKYLYGKYLKRNNCKEFNTFLHTFGLQAKNVVAFILCLFSNWLYKMGKIKFNKIWQFNRRVLFEKLSGKKLFSIIENYLELFIQTF